MLSSRRRPCWESRKAGRRPGGEQPSGRARYLSGFGLERDTGVEPATLSLGKRIGRFVGACRHSQTLAMRGDSRSIDLHSVSFGTRFCSPFAAPVLQGFLSVRDVAAQLSVSTATSTSFARRARCRTCGFWARSGSRRTTWLPSSSVSGGLLQQVEGAFVRSVPRLASFGGCPMIES